MRSKLDKLCKQPIILKLTLTKLNGLSFKLLVLNYKKTTDTNIFAPNERNQNPYTFDNHIAFRRM